MSAFLIGYMLVAIIILILLNVFLSRRKQAKRQQQQSESDCIQPSENKDQWAAPVSYEKRSVDDSKEQTKPFNIETQLDHSFTEFVDDHDKEETPFEDIRGLSRRRRHELQKQNEESRALIPKETKDVSMIKHDDQLSDTRNDASQQANAATDHLDGIKKGPIITVIILGAFVAILNQTLINVALPHMMTDLNITANTAQWLTTGYMLVNGVLIPITAFLMESFSTRKLFITAMSLFSIGSIICAVSPDFSVLMAGRVVQASGAGIIMPLMMNVLLSIFPPEKRGAAMGMVGVAMIFAPAVGPTLSGYIVENYTWRILFYIVLPIAIIDIIIAVIWLKNVTRLSYPKFDIWGIVFSTLGFGGILYAFSEAGNNGWDSAKVLASLVIGIVSLLLFIWRELTIEVPMLEFRVFKYGGFALATAISAVITMAMFAAMILVPIYLQNIRGFTPLQSGLLLLPGAILMGIMSPVTGIIFDKIGARWLALVGLTITGVTTFQFSHLTSATTYTHMVVLYSLRMFGMSMLMMPIMTSGLNSLPRRLNSHGTAMSNTMRQVAGSLGTAFLVTVMTNRTTFHLGNYSNVMTSNNVSFASHFQQLGHQLANVMGLPAQAGQQVMGMLIYAKAAEHSAISGINDAFLVATVLVGVAFILSIFIKRTSPPDEGSQPK